MVLGSFPMPSRNSATHLGEASSEFLTWNAPAHPEELRTFPRESADDSSISKGFPSVTISTNKMFRKNFRATYFFSNPRAGGTALGISPLTIWDRKCATSLPAWPILRYSCVSRVISRFLSWAIWVCFLITQRYFA